MKSVLVRLEDDELTLLKKKIKNSKLNQQSYIKFCLLSKDIKQFNFDGLLSFNSLITEINFSINQCFLKLDTSDKDIISELCEIKKRIDGLCLMLSDYLSKME